MATAEEIRANSYVGFDTITQQIEHKLLKRGFQFNVIVCGTCLVLEPLWTRVSLGRHVLQVRPVSESRRSSIPSLRPTSLTPRAVLRRMSLCARRLRFTLSRMVRAYCRSNPIKST